MPQTDFDRPGVAACELALAPESLDDYRTRIDKTAQRNGRPNGKLATNRIVKDARRRSAGDDLGIPSGRRRLLARGEHPRRRQPAALHLHPQRRGFRLRQGPARVRRARRRGQVHAAEHRRRYPLEAQEPLAPARVQVRHRPARGLEPGPGAQLGRAPLRQRPPHGVWSDNLLVLAHPHRGLDLPELAKGPSRAAPAGGARLRDSLLQGHPAGQGSGARDGRPHNAVRSR